ncbi:hypothetical protein ACLOJK_031659 [Asimina triloba]
MDEVITAKDLASQADVRLMASVYFKNSISRYWRNRRDSPGISSEEKIHLRKKLLSHLREENYQIAVQLAVLISKIGRIDYPKECSMQTKKAELMRKLHALCSNEFYFQIHYLSLQVRLVLIMLAAGMMFRPELFSVLAQQLQLADTLASHRIFLILFRTLKELSSKRLTSDQRNFSASDAQTILNNFTALMQRFPANVSGNNLDDLFLTCERWLLCSKVVRQLVISGFPSDANSVQEVPAVKEVCPALLKAVQSFLPYSLADNCLSSGSLSAYLTIYLGAADLSFEGHQKLKDFTTRACIKLMKVLIMIQNRHPYSFGDKSVLPPIMDLCLNKITNPEPEITTFEQLLIQCMVMVKSILECKEYKPSLTGRIVNENGISLEQTKKNVTTVIGDILTSLLPSERVVLLCNVLIRR